MDVNGLALSTGFRWQERQTWIALLLAIWLCILPGWGLPARANASDVTVLLSETNTFVSGNSALASLEESLLLSLKQMHQDFATIHLKELPRLATKTLIVPLMDSTPPEVLEAVLQQRSKPIRFILFPMMTMPNARIETFLQQFGYQLVGSQYIPRSTSLRHHETDLNTFIPIGTFVFKFASNTVPEFMWGDIAPAVVTTERAMLINWNWAIPLPAHDLALFLKTWPGSAPAIANAGATTPVISKPAPKPTSAPVAPAISLVPEVVLHNGVLQPSPKPIMSVSNAAIAPAPVQAAPSPNSVITASVPAVSPAPVQPAPAPKPVESVSKPGFSKQPAQAAEEPEESYTDDAYEFDEGSKPDKATISKRRSSQTQSAMAEFYNDRMRELADLQDKVNLLAGHYMGQPDRHSALMGTIHAANEQKSTFETAWFQQNFGQALGAFDNSKSTLMSALFDTVPESQVEGRAIWLDRGTIVKSASEQGLRQLIRRIAGSGFNVIYFETVNAGYPIYPSKMVAQNPDIKGWDPLAVAVDEAHKQGVELHAWVWVFAVGNTRHNRLQGQPASYPGPILSKPELASEALRGRNGEMMPTGQFEYWLSPSSMKARSFLIGLFSEIVQNYKVDGLQLDYIRYPFQKPYSVMGFEAAALNRFSAETGLDLGNPTDFTTKAWVAWKAFQVTTFVKELNQRVKSINPNLKLSAAVFPMARHGRMTMIQQDWETWVRNGWIDTLNPMAYSRSSRSLERLVHYIHNISDDKTLVYPGLALYKLNAIELLDTLEVCRRTGVMGTTLFAAAQFDSDKQMMLQTGPYKQRKTAPPHRDPLGASSQLIRETQAMVSGLIKSDRPIPGRENLVQIQDSLNAIGTAVSQLTQKPNTYETGFLLGSIRDDARLLQQQSEQWAQWPEDSVTHFQAKVLKQRVDKTVRMVNYATFQMASSQQAPRFTQANR